MTRLAVAELLELAGAALLLVLLPGCAVAVAAALLVVIP